MRLMLLLVFMMFSLSSCSPSLLGKPHAKGVIRTKNGPKWPDYALFGVLFSEVSECPPERLITVQSLSVDTVHCLRTLARECLMTRAGGAVAGTTDGY